MGVDRLLPDPGALRLERVQFADDQITITVRTSLPSGTCPLCGRSSIRVHSRYNRTLADLPWHGRAVRLQVQARRFFCDTVSCPRRIFVERLPRIANVHGRTTCRLAETRVWIGFALGGEAGSRLAGRLGMSVSPDTLLRRIRNAPAPAAPTPRALGVDDWAWRRGQRYGTILCDLEQHRPVDLLPGRSADELADWLRRHPGVTIIARDRGAYYVQGATAGAPQATKVVDRWHLLHNLREALGRVLDRHQREVREAARAVAQARSPPRPSAPEVTTGPRPSSCTQAEQIRYLRRARRLQRYAQVVELHRQGASIRAITRHLGMKRCTVRRFLRAGQFPERADRRSGSCIDPFEDFLRRRWEAGCHNAIQLTRELVDHGFRGSYDIVRRRVACWRRGGTQISSTGRSPFTAEASVRGFSPHRVSWLLLKEEKDLEPEEQTLLDALRQRCPEVKVAARLAKEFWDMVRQRRVQALDDWLARSRGPDAPREFAAFARSLNCDYAAVRAACSLPWSNGQVEGQVNRLKLIKRTMYGRGGFDLLRQRVLHAG